MSAERLQLDLFINEKRQLESMAEEEEKKEIKKSFRAAFYRINEIENTMLGHEKKLDLIMEFLFKLKENSPA